MWVTSNCCFISDILLYGFICSTLLYSYAFAIRVILLIVFFVVNFVQRCVLPIYFRLPFAALRGLCVYRYEITRVHGLCVYRYETTRVHGFITRMNFHCYENVRFYNTF